MGLVYLVYLPTMNGCFCYGKFKGKYTNPMDPSWVRKHEAAVATATNPIILTFHYYDVTPHELEQQKLRKCPKVVS